MGGSTGKGVASYFVQKNRNLEVDSNGTWNDTAYENETERGENPSCAWKL